VPVVKLFSVRRAAVGLSLGALLLAAALGGFAFRPGIWLGVVLAWLVNLFGQLRVVAAAGARPSGFVLGLRGVRMERDAASSLRLRGQAWWVGAGLQALVSVLVLLAASWVEGPFVSLIDDATWRGDAFRTLGATNLLLAAVWSLPVPFLPGAEAWLSLFLNAPDGLLHRIAVRHELVAEGTLTPPSEDAVELPSPDERRKSARRKGRSGSRESKSQRELQQAVKLLEAQVEVTRFLRDLENDTRDAARKSRKARKP